MQVYIVLILIFAIVITMFALFNSVVVPVSLLFFEVDVSLALVIIISTLIGAVLITLIDMARKLRSGKEIKGLHKKAIELEKQMIVKDELISSQRKTIEEMNLNAISTAQALNITNETVDQ